MKKHNLISHLVLSIMNVGLRGYGGYLIESYLLTDRKRVVIVIDYNESTTTERHRLEFGKPCKHNDLGGYTQAFAMPTYEDRYYIDGKLYIVFDYSLKSIERDAIHATYDGQYSKIGARVFSKITTRTILPYKKITESGTVVTDTRLLACSPNKAERDVLRTHLEESLGVSLPENAELMEKIPEKFFAKSTTDVVKIYSPDFVGDIEEYSPRTTHAQFMRIRKV